MTRTQKQVDEPREEDAEAVEGQSQEGAGDSQSTPKKSLSGKEIPRFEWKLLGESQDVIVTLFKAVDRTEVEAQLERVRKEGYYSGLRIVEADMEIKQPKPPQPPPRKIRKVTRKSVKAATRPKTTRKKTAKGVKARARVKKARASTAKRAPAKKAHPKKTASKKSRKKTSTSKAPRKTSTRKKR
ncbi:MAG: hypothetical protein ACE5HE_01530 [Phycisphaerae bacterium]